MSCRFQSHVLILFLIFQVILTLENENEHFEIIKGKGSKGTNKNARKRLQMNIKASEE